MTGIQINFNKIANKNSDAKKAFIEAIKEAGNCNRLAVLMQCNNGFISKLLHKKCLPGKDLMQPESAYRVWKAVKISGLVERLCPSITKYKKY